MQHSLAVNHCFRTPISEQIIQCVVLVETASKMLAFVDPDKMSECTQKRYIHTDRVDISKEFCLSSRESNRSQSAVCDRTSACETELLRDNRVSH
jgi:hypothetical protein